MVCIGEGIGSGGPRRNGGALIDQVENKRNPLISLFYFRFIVIIIIPPQQTKPNPSPLLPNHCAVPAPASSPLKFKLMLLTQCRSAAAGLELVRGAVEGGVAGGAGVGAGRGGVLVVGARVGGLGAFFAEDAELFCGGGRGSVLTEFSGMNRER